MNNSITIRQYQQGDEEEIVELLDLAFDGWPNFDLPCTPLEHWQWKYKDNPQSKIIMSIAETNGKVMGSHHSHSYKLKIQERIVESFKIIDAAVHPEHQKRGVWSRLAKSTNQQAKENGMQFGFGLILNPFLFENVKKQQWKEFPYELVLLARIANIDLFLKTNQEKKTNVKKTWILFFKNIK